MVGAWTQWPCMGTEMDKFEATDGWVTNIVLRCKGFLVYAGLLG